MRRIRKTGLSGLFLLLPAGMAQACTPVPERPTGSSGKASHLTIVQTDGGYIIRSSVSGTPVMSGSPCCAVSLGSNVRFDRDAILPSSTKEIEHGESR